MRETITTFNHHAEPAWLHFVIRLLEVLLFLFLVLVFREDSLGQARHHDVIAKEIERTEQRLAELGYWTGQIDGVLDSASKHALIAFQKVEGRERTGRLTLDEFEAIQNASRPEPRDKTYAHIEVDLKRQVLLVIDEAGNVTKVLPVSTGNGQRYTDRGKTQRAYTPRGTFMVLRKINGLRISSLGALYYPNYIVNGIAIHGSPSVPPFPASHGCIRIPMFAAKAFHDMAPVGTIVMVYD